MNACQLVKNDITRDKVKAALGKLLLNRRIYMKVSSALLNREGSCIKLIVICTGNSSVREGGVISLRNVSFAYPQKEDKALEEVNLQIRKGERLAIVRRSGCGKSTLVKMILGLYKLASGRVLLDGSDIMPQAENGLHCRIGAVMQDSMVFNLTIRENLLLAKPRASDEELTKACREAALDEFIAGLPDGLDTLIGEKGIKLSGGQRQRLAIARIMLVKPQIIIFDEATSALDHQTEKAIHRAIDELSKDRTVVIAAHRLSSIIKADRVVIMDQGRIVGEGCHANLKGNHEIYDALFSRQYQLLDA
jgi:ABC-type multidrug transport system fused ATPase/permease subunit